MQVTERRRLFFAPAVIALLVAGCASNTAPRGWLPPASESQATAYGGWISVRLKKGAGLPAAAEEGVVFERRVLVRKRPDRRAARVAILHRGRRVRVVRREKGWCEIELQDGRSGWLLRRNLKLSGRDRIDGELIAVNEDTVFVLSLSGLKAIAKTDIQWAKLTGYDSRYGQLGYWATLGTLSTAFHGWLLLVSAPVWMLTGITVTALQSHVPELKYPSASWDELRKYARFPQGLPAGVERRRLKPKPLPR